MHCLFFKHGQYHYGCKEFLKKSSSFLKETKPVPRAIEILRSKLKYKVKVSNNVLFDGVDPTGPDLVLLVLIGTDDYTVHAVCLIGGLVFDVSNKSGIVINRRNLDLCCGDGAVVKFHSEFRLLRCSRTH
jgi:hypothetical protein